MRAQAANSSTLHSTNKLDDPWTGRARERVAELLLFASHPLVAVWLFTSHRHRKPRDVRHGYHGRGHCSRLLRRRSSARQGRHAHPNRASVSLLSPSALTLLPTNAPLVAHRSSPPSSPPASAASSSPSPAPTSSVSARPTEKRRPTRPSLAS